jgi:uncharacterized membrane protein
VATLIAIGYEDQATARRAAAEARRLDAELATRPVAIAVLSRDAAGDFDVTTEHHPVGASASWGMFWGRLLWILVFAPQAGAGLGAVFGRPARPGPGRAFGRRVREMVAPGTSALFVVFETEAPPEAVTALGRIGGTVLESPLSREDEERLWEALHGDLAAAFT